MAKYGSGSGVVAGGEGVARLPLPPCCMHVMGGHAGARCAVAVGMVDVPREAVGRV